MKILVTGAAGCAGLAICEELVRRGYEVTGVDNGSRLEMFGAADRFRLDEVARVGAKPVQADFRALYDPSTGLYDQVRFGTYNLIVHCAAQTSHPRSIDTPGMDFEINAAGTFGLLEHLRQYRPEMRFIHLSTSKVYGERVESALRSGVNEDTPLGDQTRMTPFGISKLAADLYTQEYGRLYNLRTAVLRPNCITGGAGTRAVEQQNWLPMVVKACREGTSFTVYGHGGKQVRDVLHARDLARAVALLLEVEEAQGWPKRGEVYNVGGGQKNAISMIDAIRRVEARWSGLNWRVPAQKLAWIEGPARYGDWPWYVTDYGKLERRTGWTPEISIDQIIEELCR